MDNLFPNIVAYHKRDGWTSISMAANMCTLMVADGGVFMVTMCRDSMESNSSMQESRPTSFEAGKSFDEARMQAFKANRAKKMWMEPDSTTALWSA